MSNQQPTKPGRGTHIFNLLAMAAISSLLSQGNVVAQTTQLQTDAAKLYLYAAQLVADNRNANIQSPANSNLTFEEYPPYPRQWQQLESADIAANAEIRKLAHEARSIDHANWPVLTGPKPDFTYLNEVRSLTNDIADAALWQHLHGNDAAAIATLLDQWHLAKRGQFIGQENCLFAGQRRHRRDGIPAASGGHGRRRADERSSQREGFAV